MEKILPIVRGMRIEGTALLLLRERLEDNSSISQKTRYSERGETDMTLKPLISKIREEVQQESSLRWPSDTGISSTNVQGLVKILSKQLKGMGYSNIVKMLDQKKWKEAQKAVGGLIADAERVGRSTVELRRMFDAVKSLDK